MNVFGKNSHSGELLFRKYSWLPAPRVKFKEKDSNVLNKDLWAVVFSTTGELLDFEHYHLQEWEAVISLPRQSFNFGAGGLESYFRRRLSWLLNTSSNWFQWSGI